MFNANFTVVVIAEMGPSQKVAKKKIQTSEVFLGLGSWTLL